MLWLKVILLFLAVPGIADVLIPGLILEWLGKLALPSIGVLQIIGLILVLAGLLMIAWVCQAFVRHGKGTPAPFDPPHQFVNQGLYRWLRNPLYFGAALLIPLGETLFSETYWLILYAAILLLILHIYIVYFEEPALIRRFGRPYRKYLRTVPPWIPRIPRE
jgi:protein-S-isoprenylcysteine O-methyltransferase Ste14